MVVELKFLPWSFTSKVSILINSSLNSYVYYCSGLITPYLFLSVLVKEVLSWAKPRDSSARALNYSPGHLPLICLGVPFFGRGLLCEDWTKVIVAIRGWLYSRKNRQLSLGGSLPLLNSVLSSVLTCWMSIFKLQKWVTQVIDMVRQNFFWRD